VPAHADRRRPRFGPFPVHTEVDRIGERADLLLGAVAAVVVRLREENAGEQQGRVDRGQLDRLKAPAGAHVQEVIEEAAIAGGVGAGGVLRRGPEKAQGRQRASGGLGARDPAVFDADRVGGEGEADRGDARERRRGPAVRREAVRRRRQVPEEVEGAVLQRVEECDRVGRGARAPGVVRTTSEGQGETNRGEATTSDQNVYSAPSCRRRGSEARQVDLP